MYIYNSTSTYSNVHSYPDNAVRGASDDDIFLIPVKELRHCAAQQTKVVGIEEVGLSQQGAVDRPQPNLVPCASHNVTLHRI